MYFILKGGMSWLYMLYEYLSCEIVNDSVRLGNKLPSSQVWILKDPTNTNWWSRNKNKTLYKILKIPSTNFTLKFN